MASTFTSTMMSNGNVFLEGLLLAVRFLVRVIVALIFIVGLIYAFSGVVDKMLIVAPPAILWR